MKAPLQIPNEWVQLAQPSRWQGLHVNHLIGGNHDSEFVTPTVIISLIRRPAQSCESRLRSGRWTELDIKAGSLCYLPFSYSDRIRYEGETEAINLFVDTKWLGGKVGSEVQMLDRPLFGINDTISQTLITEIYSDNQRDAPNGLTYGESLLMSLLFRLNAKALQRPAVRVNKNVRVANLALDYIYENLHEPLSISDVAKAAGFEGNLCSFFQLIKQHTGRTPHQYILDRRLEEAKSLILRGDMTITDVALSCGFSNLGHFSSTFKRRWGSAPSAMLRSQQKHDAVIATD